MKITVLGSGAWGTALALLLAGAMILAACLPEVLYMGG